MNNDKQCCGYVGIVGRPNVGKSTLLNKILGMKLSITSRKPQTTRHQILGIKTDGPVQAIYVDTPGIHQRQSSAMNRYMNRAATSVLDDVDVILFVIQADHWSDQDEHILNRLKQCSAPVVLVINKIDKLADKNAVLPVIEKMSALHTFTAIIPISARNNNGVDRVEQAVAELLPENEHFFPDDQVTDRSSRFFAGEIIREKLVRELGKELPYTTTVNIDQYEEQGALIRIHATIFVESKGQKTIIIGSRGERLKTIGTQARTDIEKLTGRKVYLNLWVKVREGWSDDENALQHLGYTLD